MSMKGRGNVTWTLYSKKPYNFTLYKDEACTDKKGAALIKGVKTKKWSIIANVKDPTLLRNHLGYDIANKMGVGLKSEVIDIWMNGEYHGSYVLTPKSDYNMSDEGYQIEIDNATDSEDPQFTLDAFSSSSNKSYFTVKDNGAEASTEEIKAYLEAAVAAMKDTSSTKYLDYIDLDTWAAYYLLHEFYKDIDVIAGSKFMYRTGTTDADKLYAGPVWDLDVAIGRVFTAIVSNGLTAEMSKSADGWYIDSIKTESGVSGRVDSWLQLLGKHPEFMSRVYELYNEYKADFDSLVNDLEKNISSVHASAEMNALRWPLSPAPTNASCHLSAATTIGSGTYQLSYKKTDTVDDFYYNLTQYITKRLQFLSDNLTVTAPEGGSVSGETSVEVLSALTLTADAAADAYQWQRSDDGGETWDNIEGATGNTFSTTVLYTMDGTQLRCKVTKLGNVISTSRVAQVAASASAASDSVTVTVSLGSHVHDCDAVVTEPTCQCGGYTTHTCACGYSYKDSETGPSAHEYESGRCIHCHEKDPDYVPEFAGLIDFTAAESAKYITVVNQASTSIQEGKGLYLVSTKNALEPAGSLTGTAATTPKDLVTVKAEGDWTATIKFDFSRSSTRTSRSEYFGFFAGDDYQNLVGVRATTSSVQDFLRKDGTITAGTTGKATTAGLTSATTHYLRIDKEGTTYTASWSTNGTSFTEIAKYENTGIDGDTIYIDAYSANTTYYSYYVKSLNIEGKLRHENLILTSSACGDLTSVAKLSGGGVYQTGETLKLTAEEPAGFVFEGWYLGDTLISEAANASIVLEDLGVINVYKPTAPRRLIARYSVKPDDKLDITVTAPDLRVDGSEETSPAALSLPAGTVLMVSCGDGNFDHWEDESGNLLSGSAIYIFTVRRAVNIRAVTALK